MPLTIPPPRNILVSYHYFKDYDLNRFAGLRVIGDSGAYSAYTQNVTITVPELAAWANKWRHRLCWVAALDVIGDHKASQRNWQIMVDDYGIPAVPTLHYMEPMSVLDYYHSRGVDFVGLGGMVGLSTKGQLRWLISVFRYARDRFPDMRFHGWGVTAREILQLPFFSVDSSGWGAGYRYGRVTLRDPLTGKAHTVVLDGRSTYTPEIARLLTRHYGVSPSEVATSGPHNRPMMVRLSALSASVAEQQFRRLHRRNPIPAPKWGQLGGAATDGPHTHLAVGDLNVEASEVTTLTGPHYHLAMGGGHQEIMAKLNASGPHYHLAEGSAEHLEIATEMSRS